MINRKTLNKFFLIGISLLFIVGTHTYRSDSVRSTMDLVFLVMGIFFVALLLINLSPYIEQ